MRQSKTVLYIHHSTALGGAPRSLAYLIKELDRDRWRPVVLTPGDGEVAQMFRDAGADVFFDRRIQSFPGGTSPVNSPLRLLRAWLRGQQTSEAATEYVRRLSPDVVHLNSTSLFMAARGAREAAPHVRIICHARETLAGGLGTKIIRYMNHRFCDAFIALDTDGLSRLNIQGKEARVVPNFVDTSTLASYERKQILKIEHNLSNDDVVVVFLARICPINGVMEAVRMIRSLPDEFSHCHFFFFGYTEDTASATNTSSIKDRFKITLKGFWRKVIPSYLTRVRSLAQLSSNIHILPFNNQILPILGSSDILLCPFTKPHFSRSIVEAAAMGIPSLTADVPSLRTLVDHGRTGWLYFINSRESFEAGLRFLALDPIIRVNMGNEAKKKAEIHFNNNKNALLTFEIYKPGR
ncbi:glycosyltransferase [bacterium]|nr:glycosyltransferase [bacterium]